jgi:RNA polymerase sigma-70 factor (ECF subfamily)
MEAPSENPEDFEKYLQLITSYAYRIVGSISDAEDIAQEAMVRLWNRSSSEEIKNPKAWLFKVATRLSLDNLKSARVRRESYVGPWLPEPFIADSKTTGEQIELDESLSMALMVVLEKLNPLEKTAFILHTIFDFSHREISETLGVTEANSRKLLSRAKENIKHGDTRFKPSVDEHTRLTQSFLEALKYGNLNNLIALFSEEIKLHADGGGKATAARKILEGAEFIADFLVKNVTQAFSTEGYSAHEVWFNGSPGVLITHNETPITAFNFVVRNGKILTIHALRNPDKLKFFQDAS